MRKARTMWESKELTIDQIISQGLKGAHPKIKHSPEELARFQDHLNKSFRALQNSGVTIPIEGEHVVAIYNDARDMVYHTLCIDGKIMYSLGANGGLNLGELHSSIEPLFQALGTKGVPSFLETERKTTTPKKNPPVPPKGPRSKPLHAWDPVLARCVLDKADLYIAEAFYSEESGHSWKMTPDEIEQSNGALAEIVRKEGLRVEAQSIDNFIHRNRIAIIKHKSEFNEAIMGLPEVTILFSSFEAYVRSKRGVQLEDRDIFYADPDRAREVYDWFKGNNHTEHRIQNLVEAARALIMKDRPHSEGLNVDEVMALGERNQAVMRATREWQHCALAADYLTEKPKLKEEVMATFRQKEEEKLSLVERNYAGVMRLAKATIIHKKYTWPEYKFFLRGLSTLGELTTNKNVDAFDDLTINEGERYRTVRGTLVEYLSPMSHVRTRMDTYRQILGQSFRELLEQGEISPETTLESKKDHLEFGKRLHLNIDPDTRRRVFTHLNNDTPLDEYVEARSEDSNDQTKGKDRGKGEHLQRVLQYFVGLHREELIRGIKIYHESRSG